MIWEKKGIDLGLYGDSYLRRRLSTRQKNKGCASLEEFLKVLSADPREIDLLAESFIVRVTEFFRSPRTFEVLEQRIIPSLMAQKRSEQSHVLRAWSAGCSSGEEAYSLAILIRDCLRKEKERFSALIFASDIDQSSLNVARRGFYEEQKLSKVKPERRILFFDQEEGGYRVREEVRRMVVFRHHNLQDPPPFRNLDLILFRNVLIYINPESQRYLLVSFFESLNPGGYLVLGRTEGGVGAVPTQFKVADPAERIYQRSL